MLVRLVSKKPRHANVILKRHTRRRSMSTRPKATANYWHQSTMGGRQLRRPRGLENSEAGELSRHALPEGLTALRKIVPLRIAWHRVRKILDEMCRGRKCPETRDTIIELRRCVMRPGQKLGHGRSQRRIPAQPELANPELANPGPASPGLKITVRMRA